MKNCKDGQLVKITCGTYQGSVGLLRVRTEEEPPHAQNLSVTCSPMKYGGGHIIRKAGRELKGGWNGHTVLVTETQIEPAR